MLSQNEIALMTTGISNKVMFLLNKESRYRDASCNAMSKLKQGGMVDEAIYREFVEDMKCQQQ